MYRDAFLLLIKPEAIHRMIIGKVIQFLEGNGLIIVGIKMLVLSREQAIGIYCDISNASFYNELIEYITTEPCVAIAIDSQFTTIDYLSELVGCISQWGTVRGLFAHNNIHNVMHCSEIDVKSKEEAKLVFREEDLINYFHALEKYL